MGNVTEQDVILTIVVISAGLEFTWIFQLQKEEGSRSKQTITKCICAQPRDKKLTSNKYEVEQTWSVVVVAFNSLLMLS